MTDTPVTLQGFIDVIKEYGLEYFGVYYGKYRGFVVSQEDPKNLGRVKVRVPQISSDKKIETWAWPSGNSAGDDFGDFMIPPVGAPVWVTFENGDPQHPVYEGGQWGRTAHQPPEEGRSNPRNRIRKSEVWKIEMDDENGILRIALNDDSAFIEVTDDGDITIQGASITINGTSAVSVDSPDTQLTGDSATIGSTTTAITGVTTIQGRDFLDHNHNSVQPGGGNSGGVN